MTPDRYQQVMRIFREALERPPDGQRDWVRNACGDDASLCNEVQSLLKYDEGSSGLDAPARPYIRLDAGAVTREPSPLPPGLQEIDDYRLEELIGRGGMGVVYRATQRSTGRSVALKLIRPEIAGEASQRRFRTEIAMLGRLRHPGIAAIYAAGRGDFAGIAQPYIAMEYVQGKPLLEYAADAALDIPTRIDLLARLCDAIDHAHQRGVIHRDLKPGNILVETIDGRPQPRVLDFGVARLLDHDAQMTTFATQPGQIVGTLAYMSPEQLGGDENTDTRSDVYSLGVVAYELLGGRLPLDVRKTSILSAMETIRTKAPAPLSSVDRRLAGDLENIVHKALRKEPDQRYGSAAAFAQDLRRYLAGEPVEARTPSTAYVLRKFAARNRLLVGSAAVVLFALIAGFAGTSYGFLEARRASAALQIQLDEARDSAAFLANEVVGALDLIAGTSKVREKMLLRIEPQIGELLRRRPDDRELQSAHAAILLRRSDLFADEGDYVDALELRAQAVPLFESLCDDFRGDPNLCAEWSIALVKMGDMYGALIIDDACRNLYERAFEIDQRLVREHPESRYFLDNLSWSLSRLGHRSMVEGELDVAEDFFQRRHAINERLSEMAPGNRIVRYGMATAASQLAEVAYRRPDAEAGLNWISESRLIYRELLAAEPQNRMFAHAFAGTLMLEGELYRLCGANDAAEMTFTEALAAHQALLEVDIQNFRVIDMHCVAWRAMIELAMERNDFETAFRRLERCEALMSRPGGPARGFMCSDEELAAMRRLIQQQQERATAQAAAQSATP